MRRFGTAGALTAALVVVLAVGLAACGIPTDGEPRPLAAGASSTAPPTASAPSDSANVAFIYLSREGRLGEVLARVERNLDGPPTPERALRAVLAGPTGDDLAAGYSTLVPRDTNLVSAEAEGSQITIELSEEWETLRGESALGAYAQVVLTATELNGIESVRFVSDGMTIPAPTTVEDDKDVVTRADYSSLDPTLNDEPLTPTTTTTTTTEAGG